MWSVRVAPESNRSTALGNDNVGGLSFTYGLETDDTVGSSFVFNAHDAAWITFIRGLFGACQTMYRNRESAGCFNTTNFLAKMKAWQDTRPERIWIADTQRKYLRPYEDNGTETYIAMLAGRKTHQREQVKTYNAYYYSSKYVGDICTSQNIMVRGNTPTVWTGVEPANTATISMYIDCYIVVASTSYNVVAKTKARRGQTYVMDFSTIGSMGETELYFCTAPMITELSGLAHLYFKQNNFAMATNLQRLEIGSDVTGYTNPNLEGLTIGNSKMLEYLDVRNCPNVTGSLDLSGCVSLREVYLENTAFTGIAFATNGLLEIAHLPSPSSITMRELTYVDDITLESISNLTTIRIEDCDFDDTAVLTIGNTSTSQATKDIILNFIDSSTNLSRVRLIGVDWSFPDTTTLNYLLGMSGINDDSYDIAQSVLAGNVYISGSIRNQELTQYAEAWANLDVTYNPSNLITQYKVTYVNADANHTVLYETYVDQGSLPPNPVTLGLINTPTLASTDQYDYTYTGWDNISSVVISDRTVTATYSSSVRTYTVNFYSRVGVLAEQFTNVSYGSEIVPTVIPTWTDGESNNIYHLFSGWDKSTGYVRGDMNVFAVWETASTFPALGTDMKDMTPAEMYGIGQAGLQDTYWEDGDYFDFVLGHDFNFSNVNDIEIGSDVTLTGIQRDTFVHGGYYFNGESAFTTNIKLFDEDSPTFTMAIDFQFNPTDTGATLISNHVGNTAEGFRFYYNGTAPTIQWGDQSVAVGSSNMRDIVVLRHPEGSRYLYVYSAGNTGASDLFATSVTKTTLLRSNTTQTDEPLTFGGIHYSSGFRNYGKGTIHWCKIWLDDLGDTNAYKLATWSREDYRMEYWGKGKYYYADSSTPCKASFIGNSELGHLQGRGYYMNSSNTNVGGWDESLMRTFINNRVFNAMPTVIQSLIKSVEIRATAGNKSTEIITSFDKIYLPSYREVGSGTTANGYIEEVGTSIAPISLFPNNASRAKFKGKIRAYSSDDVTIYSCNQEPAALYQTDVEPGTLWINTSDSSRLLIFVSKDEIDQYGLTPTTVADSDYALGGWFTANYWWGRSPALSSSAYFHYVSFSGYAGYGTNASGVNGVVPSFSF